MLVAVPFVPVVPWMLAAGPDPVPMPDAAPSEILSIPSPIPKGAADVGSVRGPSPPLTPAAARKASRAWDVKRIDGGEWRLLMTPRFALRGDVRTEDLKAAGAFAERFLDAVHRRLQGDLTDLRLSIRVFRSDEDFSHWVSCREATGTEWFYDRPGGEITLLFGPATDVSTFCAHLMRGLVLQYLDRAVGFTGPDSIGRDMSEWMADYIVFKDRVEPRRARGDIGGWLRNAEAADREAGWLAWAKESE